MITRTELMYIHPGEPSEAALCPRCSHVCMVTFPLTGILMSGVRLVESLTVCAECDSIAEAVVQHVARLQRFYARQAP